MGLASYDIIIEILVVVISFIGTLIYGIVQMVKNRRFEKFKFNVDSITQKLTIFNEIFNIANNFNQMSEEEIKRITEKLLFDGVAYFGYMTAEDNKELNKFIEFLKGNRSIENFDINMYAHNLLNKIKELQTHMTDIGGSIV